MIGDMEKKPSMHHYCMTIYVWLSLLLFLYFGVGAYLGAYLHVSSTSSEPTIKHSSSRVIYQGVEFNSIEDVKEVLKREPVGIYFPWVFSLPFIATILILAFCSGAFGGIFRIFKELGIDKRNIAEIPVVYMSFCAGFTGLMVLGVSYLLPSMLTASKNTPWPISIMFLSIFGGFFPETTMKWLEKLSKKLFPSR